MSARSKKQRYQVTFTPHDYATPLANVTFHAASHAGIMREVRTIARQVNLMRTPWEVRRDGVRVAGGRAISDATT